MDATQPRLIIVCGLPGSGKTTHAKRLQAQLSAIRFSADEWMDALGLDLWDERRRAKIEALQWQLSQEFLAQGLTVIIEWGTWEDQKETTCERAHGNWAPPSSCTIFLQPWMYSSIEYAAAKWKIRRSDETSWCTGPRYSKRRHRTR